MCDNGSPLEETGGSDTLGSVDDLGWNSKSPGRTSSRREPTAEKARMARTPKDFKAAMLARAGTADGLML